MSLRSSFYWPMRLLTGRRHRSIRAIYAFCKVVDDIADSMQHSEARKLAALTGMERRVRAGDLSPKLKLALLLYNIPPKLLLELIEGMRLDANGSTASVTEAELERYCYLVAGTVGLMSIRVFGCQDAGSERFAMELGQILQRINILRDIQDDAIRGRNYLPKEWGATAAEQLHMDVEQRIGALEIPYADRWKLLPALAMLGIYEEWLRHTGSSQRRRLSVFQKIRGMVRGFFYAFNAPQTGVPVR